MSEIIVSACETLEATIQTAVEQLIAKKLGKVMFFYQGVRYTIVKQLKSQK